jgi:hypothetical protein
MPAKAAHRGLGEWLLTLWKIVPLYLSQRKVPDVREEANTHTLIGSAVGRIKLPECCARKRRPISTSSIGDGKQRFRAILLAVG